MASSLHKPMTRQFLILLNGFYVRFVTEFTILATAYNLERMAHNITAAEWFLIFPLNVMP